MWSREWIGKGAGPHVSSGGLALVFDCRPRELSKSWDCRVRQEQEGHGSGHVGFKFLGKRSSRELTCNIIKKWSLGAIWAAIGCKLASMTPAAWAVMLAS